MRIHINQTQCGFVIKNGCYQKMIFAGTYYYPACMGYKVVIEEMRGRVSFKEVPLKVLKEDKVFLSRVTIAEVPEGQLGVLYINHAASAVVTDREAAYWNVWEPCELRMIDMREPAMDRTVEKSLLRLIDQQYYKKIEILPGEKGLLYQDNILTDELGPGTYYYWLYARDVLCRVVDLKMKELEVSGQEILTADRVGIRLNLTATYRIADPRRLVETIKGVENQLYTRIQLIVREYIGRYRLDEISGTEGSHRRISGTAYEGRAGAVLCGGPDHRYQGYYPSRRDSGYHEYGTDRGKEGSGQCDYPA